MKKRLWTERETAYLCRHYADTPMEVLESKLRRKRSGIWAKAAQLGLRKSAEYWTELGRKVSSSPKSIACRYAKGHESANKGKRIEEYMSAEAIAKCSRTRFKPGHVPHNTREMGSESLHADGFVYLKTEDGIVLKHRYVWEQAHGPIPDGYVVTFADGDRTNCDLSNLRLITREDVIRRIINSETPERRAARMSKMQASRNASIRRDRIRIHWGLEPVGNLVKKW